MNLSRMDLADTGSPIGLVREILRLEPKLPVPVPIEDLARQLDIIDIVPLETTGYEGGLLTSRDKFSGTILFNETSPRGRRRFTVGHELGHFLLLSHMPDEQGRFLCSARDMRMLEGREADRRVQMEIEANRFASLILMPPPALRRDLGLKRDPSLDQVVELAKRYDVSKEAMVRNFVEYRTESLAILISKDGILQRDYRFRDRFPALTVGRGRPLPLQALLNQQSHRPGAPSLVTQADAGVWIDIRRGEMAPDLYEQTLLQANGFAMTMLWLERPPDDNGPDEDADLTARQRYQRQQERFAR